MEHGPWAARYCAARLYAQRRGYLHQYWDWAAQSLSISAPPLFDGVFGSVRGKSPAVSPPSKQMDEVPNPKLSLHLDEGVSPLDEDPLNCQRRPGRATISPSPSPSTNYGKSTPSSYRGETGGRRPENRYGDFQPRGGHRDRTPSKGAGSRLRPRPTPPPPSAWSQGWNC